MSSHSITSRWQMVLQRTSLTVVGGRVLIGGSSILIRYYSCGWAMGVTACGRDKTTAKLTAIKCRLGTTLLAPAMSSSAVATVKAPESSSPCIALVSAECVNLSNNLVHVFMHAILL